MKQGLFIFWPRIIEHNGQTFIISDGKIFEPAEPELGQITRFIEKQQRLKQEFGQQFQQLMV